jgi:hypothetical protein
VVGEGGSGVCGDLVTLLELIEAESFGLTDSEAFNRGVVSPMASWEGPSVFAILFVAMSGERWCRRCVARLMSKNTQYNLLRDGR